MINQRSIVQGNELFASHGLISGRFHPSILLPWSIEGCPLFFRCFFRAKKLHCEFCVKICFSFVDVIHTFEFFKVRWSHSDFNMPPPPQKIPKPEQLNPSRLKVGFTNPQRPPVAASKGEGTKLVMTSLGHHHLHKGANRSRLVLLLVTYMKKQMVGCGARICDVDEHGMKLMVFLLDPQKKCGESSGFWELNSPLHTDIRWMTLHQKASFFTRCGLLTGWFLLFNTALPLR